MATKSQVILRLATITTDQSLSLIATPSLFKHICFEFIIKNVPNRVKMASNGEKVTIKELNFSRLKSDFMRYLKNRIRVGSDVTLILIA